MTEEEHTTTTTTTAAAAATTTATANYNLRSDTVTRPTAEVRAAMASAVVGDDAHGDCPTMKDLERLAADMTGKESSCFVVSGTAGNLCSIMSYCEKRGSEVITGDKAHVVLYEGGGIAAIAGALVRTCRTEANGTLNLHDVEDNIRKSNDIMFPQTVCIAIETTHCAMGGTVLPLSFFKELRILADKWNIPIHLDGARLFNAAVALGVNVSEITKFVDSVTFSLSKCLGAPVGSIVCGNTKFIKKVRRARKMTGGTSKYCIYEKLFPQIFSLLIPPPSLLSSFLFIIKHTNAAY